MVNVSSATAVDSAVLAAVAPLRDAGFAVHWLRERSKAPIAEWSEAPVLSAAELLSTHRPGNNLGVRLGEPSLMSVGWYLHVIDMDIRVADLADEAWEALEQLFPDVALDELPCVQSGSGGESRHLYLLTDKPFRSKMLRLSEGKHRTFDKAKGRDVWHHDWEIELYGTGKQVVVPPSIHPKSDKPYLWLREFDFALLDLGIGPFLPSSAVERLAVAEHSTYEFESREPLTFSAGQLDRVLRDIPDERIDDYHDWITLGQALHHQYGASDEGFELWLTHSARSSKFDPKDRRNLLRKWRGFGKNRRQPVTMASIVEWAKDARVAALRASLDEEDFDEEVDDDDVRASPKLGESTDGHVAGGSGPATDASDFDDILGGADAEVDPIDAIGDGSAADDAEADGADDEDEEDDIDAIGSNRPVKGQSRAVSGDWISLLDINDEGAIKPSLHNVELIVTHDPRLVGLPQLNEFTQETVQRCAPGTKANRRRNAAKSTRQLAGRVWQVRDTLNGELWSDDRDFAIRSILEAPGTQGGYGIKVTDRDLKAAIVLSANGSAFHPVREYLEGLTWDGTARVEMLFTDYVGAPLDAYSRSVSRLMLVAAVTRIFEPGHKFDFAVILEGLQGKRKSTFIKTLGRSWFGELNADWTDSKQLIELMQGKWIMEIPELTGLGRADVRAIKAFISTDKDRARLAYARRAGEFPRQCIFIGSTNDKNYQRDDTGGRRFWPMHCTAPSIDTVRLERNIDQLWGEAVALYRAMRVAQPFGSLPLYLTDEEAQTEALRLQESRREESAEDLLAGEIEAWLNRPMASADVGDEALAVRNEVCVPEIWADCLGRDPLQRGQSASQLVGRAMARINDWEKTGRILVHPRYGKQRVWERGGIPGRLARAA